MNINSPRTRALASLPAVLVLVLAADSQAQVKNGHFEKGPTGGAPVYWKQLGGVVQDGPEGAGLGGPGVDSAVLTNGPGVPLVGGYKGAAMGQTFPCGPTNPNLMCSIRFAYAYDRQPQVLGSKAFVVVSGPMGPAIAELPDNIPPGPSVAQISYPACGPMKLVFGVVEPNAAGPFLSTLLIDHVVAKCDAMPWPNATTLELHTDINPNGPAADLIHDLCDKMGPWQDLGDGKVGAADVTPVLEGHGPATPGGSNGLTLSEAAPNRSLLIVAGLDDINAPFFGGTLVPRPDVLISGLSTDANGGIALPLNIPAGLTGQEAFFQMWVHDNAASYGAAASNALSVVIGS